MGTKEKHYRDWTKFLNDKEVRYNLTCAALYMTTYELLISALVQKIRDFYWEIKDGKLTVGKDYQEKVKSLYPKDIVIASALWWKNSNAINDHDIERIKYFRTQRNIFAHELPNIISDSDLTVNTEDFKEMRDLYHKLQLWWFKEIEIHINSYSDEWDIENLDCEEAISFVMLTMEYMVNIVNDEVENRKLRLLKEKEDLDAFLAKDLTKKA